MTHMLETLKHPPNNKKRITITLSEITMTKLDAELKHAKKLNKSWNRSKLIDAILDYELTQILENKL